MRTWAAGKAAAGRRARSERKEAAASGISDAGGPCDDGDQADLGASEMPHSGSWSATNDLVALAPGTLCSRTCRTAIPVSIAPALTASPSGAADMGLNPGRGIGGRASRRYLLFCLLLPPSYHSSSNSMRLFQQRYLPATGRDMVRWKSRQYSLPTALNIPRVASCGGGIRTTTGL